MTFVMPYAAGQHSSVSSSHRAEDIKVLAQESLLLLRETTETKAIYDVVAWLKENARKITNANDIIQALSDKAIVFGFASDRTDMPAAFRSLADGIVTLDPVDERALAATFQTIFHSSPPPSILSAAAALPIDVLNICLQRGITLRQATGRIQRYLAASREPANHRRARPPSPRKSGRTRRSSGLGKVAGKRHLGLSRAAHPVDRRRSRSPG